MAIDRKPWQRLLYEIWASVTEGHAFEVESLSVTENGTYTAEEGKAYSPVTVNVAGGASFGTPQSCYQLSGTSTIGVGDSFYLGSPWLMEICEIDSGDDVIVSSYSGEYLDEPQAIYPFLIASGLTVKSAILYAEGFDYNFQMAIVEAEYDEEYEKYFITSVVQDLTSSISQSSYTTHGENEYVMFSFVVPEVPEGKYLVYSVQYPD